MAILDILHFPDPRLRTEAKPIKQVTPKVQQLVDDMFETMYKAPGIGLAATQVNVHRQVIVIDTTEDKSNPLCFINPKITQLQGDTTYDEGCLSVPSIYETIHRAEKITVEALNREGETFTLEADGLLAICIQHEIDHLKGKLFVDYLSPLKRQRIAKRLDKQNRSKAA
ncbi:peptide deformylase [Candidatus Albibeggiatoa sp. nov. NOAA]|uniref:peptide deformylase n=1 Tax=Candidatus Albibeggiatoa sp. nov. NOAA TaxID=3162724 RepID=UPI0033017C82|nr:peptide deformylase [Thiotrichaceae bacterium]